jgi:hypothetical protein
MRLTATIEDAAPYLLSKSEMNAIGRDAIAAAGLFWHANFKRRHFQMEAFDLYGYRKRSKKWEAERAALQRIRGLPDSGGRPLVFTGESERLAMSQNRVKSSVARDTGLYHADVTVSAPTLNYHANEMTRTTDEEDAAMEAKFAEVFQQGIESAWKSHGLSSAKIELGRQQLSAA